MTNQGNSGAITDPLATARRYLADAQGYADAARMDAQLSAAERISLAGAAAAIAFV
jgi:hypothetical protein